MVLYCLHDIFRRDLVGRVPVYVNSPIATNVTERYEKFVEYHRLSSGNCADVCDVAEFVRTVEESKELSARRSPMVVISAGG